MNVFKLIAPSILAVVITVGIMFVGIPSYRERERQRTIVNEVLHLVEDCKHMGDARISIRGKCLVWDVIKDRRSGAYSKLPGELKASSPDSQITVFMIVAQRNVMVGRYSTSGQPAYRQYMDVCVAYWPERKAVGMHPVVSREPPLKRPVADIPEYGDPQ